MSQQIIPNKSLGQHWLRDQQALEAMCDAAGIAAGDMVLEIGPGLGTLTDKLLARGAKVVAVEFDGQLAGSLKGKYSNNPDIEIVQADILKFDLTTLPPKYKVVANIPYYLTSKLLRILCESSNPFHLAALLVQKEVAERVCAEKGDTSMLSVSVQFFARVGLGPIVPAALFTPPPKVDSQILMLEYAGPQFPDIDQQQFFAPVKAGFRARRKKLRSSLSGGLRMSKPEIENILNMLSIDPNMRAQELSLEDWYKIASTINE